MRKEEFLAELRNGLSGLPQADVEERLAFYSESIDDRMEEGLAEEEAVAGLGSVDGIVSQTLSEIPLTKLVREKMKPKRTFRAWEIVLLVLGFPLWFPLLIAAGAVVLSLYITVWALLVSLWAIEISLAAGALGTVVGAAAYMIRREFLIGVAALGTGLFCAGLAVFLFFGCVAATKGLCRLTKKAALRIKTGLVRKEGSK